MQKSVTGGWQGKGRAVVNELIFWRKGKKASMAGTVIDGECGLSEGGEEHVGDTAGHEKEVEILF